MGMSAREFEALEEFHDVVEENILYLRKQVEELKATIPTYAGVWQRAGTYQRGQMVTDRGTLWFCTCSTTDRPGSSDAWQLMVKTPG